MQEEPTEIDELMDEPMEIDEPMEMDHPFETEQMEKEMKIKDLKKTSYISLTMTRYKMFYVVMLKTKIIKAEDMSNLIEIVRRQKETYIEGETYQDVYFFIVKAWRNVVCEHVACNGIKPFVSSTTDPQQQWFVIWKAVTRFQRKDKTFFQHMLKIMSTCDANEEEIYYHQYLMMLEDIMKLLKTKLISFKTINYFAIFFFFRLLKKKRKTD